MDEFRLTDLPVEQVENLPNPATAELRLKRTLLVIDKPLDEFLHFSPVLSLCAAERMWWVLLGFETGQGRSTLLDWIGHANARGLAGYTVLRSNTAQSVAALLGHCIDHFSPEWVFSSKPLLQKPLPRYGYEPTYYVCHATGLSPEPLVLQDEPDDYARQQSLLQQFYGVSPDLKSIQVYSKDA